MSISSIQIKCPLGSCCSDENVLSSPEILCGHMAKYHDFHTIMASRSFESFAHFQIWLSDIEDSRCDGGYLGSSQGPSYEHEYYLLCRRRPSTNVKRRRMSDESLPDKSSVVTCTAFVHVFETIDGRVTVHYCLDHCGHSESDEIKESVNANVRNRFTLKRSSPCSNVDCHDHYDKSSSSSSTSPYSSIDLEDDEDASNNNRKPLKTTLTSLNHIIAQRLDNTAHRLKAITKVLQDLAVDINNSDCNMII